MKIQAIEKTFKQHDPHVLAMAKDATYTRTRHMPFRVETAFLSAEGCELFTLYTSVHICSDCAQWQVRVYHCEYGPEAEYLECVSDAVFWFDLGLDVAAAHDRVFRFLTSCATHNFKHVQTPLEDLDPNSIIDYMTTRLISIQTALSGGRVQQARILCADYTRTYEAIPNKQDVMSASMLADRVERIIECMYFVDNCLFNRAFHAQEHQGITLGSLLH